MHSTPLLDQSAFIIAGGLPAADLRDPHLSAIQLFTLSQGYLRNANPTTMWCMRPPCRIQLSRRLETFAAFPRTRLLSSSLSVYSLAVPSMCEDDCRTKLSEETTALLFRYLAATQQVLAAADFLRSTSLAVL